MIYIILLPWVALIAFGVGAKSPGAGVAIVLGGLVLVFLLRKFNEWDERRAALAWERHKETAYAERRESIRSQFQKSGVRLHCDEYSKPLAFIAKFDAEAIARENDCAVLKVDEIFFLASGVDVPEKEGITFDYIAQEFGSSKSDMKRSGIQLRSPSAAAIETQEQEERRIREEQERILAARLIDIERRSSADLGPQACCLYIMVSSAAVKIGVSNRPEERLRQVQTGHHEKLRLHKTWWFQSTDDAMLVERTIHAQLKVRGSHASGEWFKIKPADAVQSASNVIQHLSASGSIDKDLLPKIDAPLNDLELALGQLLNLPWQLSKKGNEYLRLPGHLVTVFRRKRSWSFMHNDEFAKDQYPTKEAAKAAALRQVLNAPRA